MAVAYDDYVRALTIDPTDARRARRTGADGDGLRSRGSDALAWMKSLTADRPPSADVLVATSKLLAAIGARADAIDSGAGSELVTPMQPAALEQLASLHADAGDTVQLDAVVARAAAGCAGPGGHASYYAAVAAFLHGDARRKRSSSAERAIAIDPQYAPVYDLIGAAYTRLGSARGGAPGLRNVAQLRRARQHGLHEPRRCWSWRRAIGAAAAQFFAEALWLAPESQTARKGLSQSQ